MVNGCSAVLLYLMWRKEVWSGGGAEEDSERVWSEEMEDGGEKLRVLSDKALEHFKILEDLSPTPSYSMDNFIKVHSKVMCQDG